MRPRNAQAVLVERRGMLIATNECPDLSDEREMRGIQTSDRAATDDTHPHFTHMSPRRHSLRLHRHILLLSAGARRLQRAENAISVVVRFINDDAFVEQRILQSGGNRMNRRSTTLAHPLRARVTVRRRRFDKTVFHTRHVDGGDGRVVAERAGQHVSRIVIHAVFHQRGADAMRRRTVHLAFDDHWVDDFSAIVNRNVIEHLGIAGFRINLDDGNVQLR